MFLLRFILLFATWCAFSGMFDALHLSLGVLASLWVAGVSTHIALTERYHLPHGALVWTLNMLTYTTWLLVQVVKSNLQVMKLAFTPNVLAKLDPVVVEFRTRLVGDFPRFLLAHSITLTPGTVVIRVDGDRFTVHALTKKFGAGVPGQMEERLLKIFHGAEVVSDG